MRTYTEGNLRKRQKRDGTWEWFGQISYTENGKQRRLSHYTGVPCDPPTEDEQDKDEKSKRKRGERPSGKGANAAQKEFKTWRDSLIEEERMKAEQEPERPEAASMSVSEYTESYIERGRRVDGQELTKSSVLDYRLVSRYFTKGEKPVADIKICDLKPIDVREWEDALLNEGLSGVTVAKAHRLLHLICQDALSLEAIDRNPCAAIRPPKRTQDVDKRPNGLSDSDLSKAALTLAMLNQTPKVVAAQIALYVGLRQGEVCALQWRDVDLDGIPWEKERQYQMVDIEGPKMRIHQSVGRSSGGCYVKPPKTKNGYRIIPICGHLLDVLRQHRAAMWAEWDAINESMGVRSYEEDFLDLYVVGTVDGRFYNPTVLSRQWATTSKDLGLIGSDGRYVSFHDLRRAFSTIAQANDISEKSYKYVLGHSSPDLTTNTYTAPVSKGIQRAAEVVAQELDSAFPSSAESLLD